MDLQHLLVAAIVPACTLYAAWRLVPVALKRRAVEKLSKVGALQPLATRLQRDTGAAGGCDCSDCDNAVKPPAETDAVTPVKFYRRPR